MSLTDTAIRNAKPAEKAVRMFDGGGLYLEIVPSGGKWWRLKYRFNGKEKRLSLVATHQKAQADMLVAKEGLIKHGKAHPAARLSVQLAASMAALAANLRLCQSSRTRPDAAGLKRALSGARP